MPESAWLWLLLGVGLLLTLALLGGPQLLVDLAVSALLLAVVTAAMPALGGGYQLVTYLASTLVLLPACYAVAFRLAGGRRRAVAPAQSYGGEQGVVVPRGLGLGVQVHGETFPARATDGAELRAGEVVTVVRIRGVTAYVRRPSGPGG